MPNLVLIADDDPGSMKLACDMLGVFNYRVIRAVNGLQALTLARSQLPDLILIDLQLPAKDGVEAARVLKAEPLTRHIPLIATSSYTTRNDEPIIRAAGYDGCLTKPLKVGAVLQTVEDHLGAGAPGFARGEES